ncbi:hypothetical protein [Pseudoalteromonas agarivorans]|uniref:hypothetical protein n=1 Tax=Pseudoalteromonas agarivorans TaxID=176102 RepID=UPI0003D6493F|nr:hypothetical protein [Pseudoalteromonas agarivorans]ETJ48205.1 hypothetical protein X564_10445 [Pseudoalteromonas agarivorans]
MDNIDSLRKQYKLDIESPFTLSLRGDSVTFDALIKGFGAPNGMIISKSGQLLQSYRDEISSLGYGYSSFNIFGNIGLESFNELLEDWGKID